MHVGLGGADSAALRTGRILRRGDLQRARHLAPSAPWRPICACTSDGAGSESESVDYIQPKSCLIGVGEV